MESVANLDQGTSLIAKSDFSYSITPKSRTLHVCVGQRFWVTTPKTSSITLIERHGKGHINKGWNFGTIEDILRLFTVIK